MSQLQANYRLKLGFQKFNYQDRGKWLIHGTKHHMENQLQCLNHPCRIFYVS